MSRLNHFVKLLIGCCVIVLYVKADIEDNSVIRQVEELQEILEKFTTSSKEYTDARIKEINTLLGTSSSKWDFIRDVSDILVWWSTDMNRREDMIKSKLPSVLSNTDVNNAFQELKQELKVNLEAATKFWHNEVDKSLKRLRENPSIFKGLIREPIFTTEHPWLHLSPEHQPIYEAQMRNLTNIASITKDIIRLYLEQIQPNLPDITDITYMSYKTKFDKFINTRIKLDSIYIDSNRIFATERVSGDWRIQGKNGPSQEEFDKEYNQLAQYATNIIKNLEKTTREELKLYENQS